MNNNETRKHNHKTLMAWEEQANIRNLKIVLMLAVNQEEGAADVGVFAMALTEEELIKKLDALLKMLKANPSSDVIIGSIKPD